MPRPRIVIFLLGVLALLDPSASGQTEEIRALAAGRLASHLAQTATLLVESAPDNPDNILTAHALAREASDLVPSDVDLLRFRLAMEALVEDEAGYKETLIRLSAADPDDQVVRLKRLRLAFERYQNADDRIAAYKRLLAGDDLDPTVASRLAFDLALLHRRRGDLDEFGDALARAVALDPANRHAVAIATGFFRMNVDDAEAEAELLVALLHADPLDVVTQSTLAELLLDHGAYVGAARMHQLAIRTIEQIGNWPPDEFVADLALAHLGSGRPDLALRIIEGRQRELNDLFRAKLRQEEPELTSLERAKQEATLHPTLLTVKAAMLRLDEDSEAVTVARAAIASFEKRIRAAQEGESRLHPQEIATWRLHQALVAIVLAGDVTETRRLLDEAEHLSPLNENARQRFDGWIALRSGDAVTAVQLLEPLAATDPVAAIGLAEAELERGRRREAVRHLLAAATADSGTVIGVWAGRRLVGLVGRQVSLSEEARRLEALIERVPRSFDLLPETPSLALSLDVDVQQAVFQPYEPIIVSLTLSNNSQFPLAIDRDGPIRPQLMLQFETTFNRRDLFAATPPIVIDIDRRLRLEPRERLVIPVDVRRFHLGQALNEAILVGAFVRVRAITNFAVRRNGAIEPGLLGLQNDSTTIRVEGERVTPEWAIGMVRELIEVDSVQDLTNISLLGHLPAVLDQRLESYQRKRDHLRIRTDVGSRKELEVLDAEIDAHVRLMSVTSDALLKGYAQLDEISQAWLLAVLPVRALPDSLRLMAQRSDSRIVQLSYLLYKLSGENDPLIEAGLRSDDETVRLVAATFARRMHEISEQGAPPDRP